MQPYIAIASLALAGLSYGSPTSPNNRRFVSGNCGIHVTQWQRGENGVGDAYEFDVRIVDAIGAIIGGTNRLAIDNFSSASLASELPYVLVISAGSTDSDPVEFAYAGYHFSSSNGCGTGGYGDGNRDMDCGFPC
ncbi:hypothetical protein F4859DRAFT_508196 [Xylaria cf. heliscus]|nr:hypothetical protein F4859DRAFT_508196 [Xylaria cf. heliscus]